MSGLCQKWQSLFCVNRKKLKISEFLVDIFYKWNYYLSKIFNKWNIRR